MRLTNLIRTINSSIAASTMVHVHPPHHLARIPSFYVSSIGSRHPKKVIIDTDAGVDDAIALILAL
jgi:hypothetical protein